MSDPTNAVTQQIERWVKEQIAVEGSRERGPCKKFVLRHLNVANKIQGDVYTVNVPRDQSIISDPDHIIEQIAEHAQQDANDQNSGLQKYAVYAYFHGDPNYSPRKVFRVAADEAIEREVDPSEPPTERGITTQLMRHNEIIMKNSMVVSGYQMQTLQKENARLRDQNDNLMKEHFGLLVLMQEMMDGSHKRRLEEKQAELQMSMLEGTFEHLKIALPIIVNRWAGKEVIPQKMNRGFYLLSSLLEGMSTEQQNMLQSSLSPQQLALLAEILQVYEEERDKAKKKISTNGHDGAKLLTKLFEKRTDLVQDDKAVVIEDEKLRSIEERAQGIMRRALGKEDDKSGKQTTKE